MAWKQLEMELRGTTGKQLGNMETPQLLSVGFQSPPTSQTLGPSPLSLALPPKPWGPSTSIPQPSFPFSPGLSVRPEPTFYLSLPPKLFPPGGPEVLSFNFPISLAH